MGCFAHFRVRFRCFVRISNKTISFDAPSLCHVFWSPFKTGSRLGTVQMTSGQKRRKDRHQKGEKKCDSQNEETLLLWKNRGIVMESSCGFILKAENLGRYRWTDWRWIIHGSFMKNNHPFRNFVLDMEVFQTNTIRIHRLQNLLWVHPLQKEDLRLLTSRFLGGLYYTDPY